MKSLKHLFQAFLRSRHALGLFRRNALPSGTAVHHSRSVSPTLTRELLRASRDDIAAVLARTGSSEDGLTREQARAALTRLGPNEVEHEKPLPGWLHLWYCYRNPFNLLLTLLAVVSYATEDMKATVVIASMVLLSTLLRFVQEGRSNRAAARLKAMVSSTATVLRRNGGPAAPADADSADAPHSGFGQQARRYEVPLREVVTGESLPVEKRADASASNGTGVLDASNLLFMGTNVVSGTALAVVLATGNRSYFGTIATRVTSNDRAPTAFETGVNSVSWLLIRFAAVMVPVVLFINGYTKGDWAEAFLFALSVAVGLTPEMLPMIVTSTLAKGAVVLSRRKVVVKRLDAIQNFGAMDVLCTDKTGTLTQDRIVLERHTDAFGQPCDETLRFAYLNSHYQTGLKNLLDHAVLEHVELHTQMRVAEDYRKVDEIPFDFERRRMSVVVAERNHHHELICKGAVEEILGACTRLREGDGTRPLDEEQLARVRRVTRELNREGLRVVAVAMKEVPPHKSDYGVADESELTLIGYIAFLDPPKETTADALAALAAHGVAVKLLTGDNELVAAKVCRDVGLPADHIILGTQIEHMNDEMLRDRKSTRLNSSHLVISYAVFCLKKKNNTSTISTST